METWQIIERIEFKIKVEQKNLKFSREQEIRYSNNENHVESDVHKHQSEIMYENISRLSKAKKLIEEIESSALSRERIDEIIEHHNTQ